MASAVDARAADLRSGIAVELVTIAWMVIEAVIAVGAGVASQSLSLQAFGLDSVIELIAGGVLLWRLLVEQRARRSPAGQAPDDRIMQAERRASRVVGWALLGLAAYIVLSAAINLLTHTRAESSLWGVGLALAAALIMPALWRVKLRVAQRIGSDALKADAACSVVCAYMSLTLLIGLGLNLLFGWWWADSLAALALLYFIIREGREALEAAAGRDTCACGE